MKAAKVVQTVTAAGFVIRIREYHDGRFGYDYRHKLRRYRVRLRLIGDAVRSATAACQLLAGRRLTKRDLRQYTKAFGARDIRPARDTREFRKTLSEMARTARARARAKGMKCTLTTKWIVNMGERQGWSCAVTGLPFDTTSKGHWHRNPFGLSLDRIDCSKGYTPDNVRLVATCVNLAMNEWGEETFSKMCRAFCQLHG